MNNSDPHHLDQLNTNITEYDAAIQVERAAADKLHAVKKQQQELTAKRAALLTEVSSDPDKALDPTIRQNLANMTSDLELLAAALGGLTERAKSAAEAVATRRNAIVQDLDRKFLALRRRFVRRRTEQIDALVRSWSPNLADPLPLFQWIPGALNRACSWQITATALQDSWLGQTPHVSKFREAHAFLVEHTRGWDGEEDSDDVPVQPAQAAA